MTKWDWAKKKNVVLSLVTGDPGLLQHQHFFFYKQSQTTSEIISAVLTFQVLKKILSRGVINAVQSFGVC